MNICCIFNMAPHYRMPIFSLMSENFDCDFYFGDRMQQPIKKLNYNELKGFKKEFHNVFIRNTFYWQRKSVRLVFKNYDYFVLSGEPFCISYWVILLLAKLLGKKTVTWTHGFYGREGGVKKVVKKAFFKLFTKIMVYSDYSIGLMKKEGIDEKKMYCIANALDTDSQLVVRQNLKKTDIFSSHFGNDDPVVFYIGRIQKIKRLDLLVESFKNLKEDGLKCNLVIVGKDDENVGLPKIINELEIENSVWLYGPCYDEATIGEMFYNSAVCVSPGNVGLTSIHALTYGCPVVTHDNFPYQMPEFEAITPDETGSFFKMDDVDDMAEKIRFWLEKTPEDREKTRELAYRTIDEKWNVHYQINVMKKVFV